MLPSLIAKCQVINKNTGFQLESLRFTGELHKWEKVYIMIFHHRNATLCHLYRGFPIQHGWFVTPINIYIYIYLSISLYICMFPGFTRIKISPSLSKHSKKNILKYWFTTFETCMLRYKNLLPKTDELVRF